jgi:hypothetical protein
MIGKTALPVCFFDNFRYIDEMTEIELDVNRSNEGL